MEERIFVPSVQKCASAKKLATMCSRCKLAYIFPQPDLTWLFIDSRPEYCMASKSQPHAWIWTIVCYRGSRVKRRLNFIPYFTHAYVCWRKYPCFSNEDVPCSISNIWLLFLNTNIRPSFLSTNIRPFLFKLKYLVFLTFDLFFEIQKVVIFLNSNIRPFFQALTFYLFFSNISIFVFFLNRNKLEYSYFFGLIREYLYCPEIKTPIFSQPGKNISVFFCVYACSARVGVNNFPRESERLFLGSKFSSRMEFQ